MNVVECLVEVGANLEAAVKVSGHVVWEDVNQENNRILLCSQEKLCLIFLLYAHKVIQGNKMDKVACSLAFLQRQVRRETSNHYS